MSEPPQDGNKLNNPDVRSEEQAFTQKELDAVRTYIRVVVDAGTRDFETFARTFAANVSPEVWRVCRPELRSLWTRVVDGDDTNTLEDVSRGEARAVLAAIDAESVGAVAAPESTSEQAPDSGGGDAPESVQEEATDSGAGLPAPTIGPWLRRGDELTRTAKLLAKAGDDVRFRLEWAKQPPEKLSVSFNWKPGNDHAWAEGGAGAFLADFFDAAMQRLDKFEDAAWLFGAFAGEKTWRLLHRDMEWIWNARAGFHGREPAPPDADSVVSDIDRIRECTLLGEPALFRGTGFGEKVPFSEVAGYLRGRGGVSGDGTGFWFEHAWGKLADAGLTRITAENPREMVAVHAETLAMLTEEFQALMLDEEDGFEYHNHESGFLSFRQQRMALDCIDTEESARLHEALRESGEGEEGWEPEWEQEHDLAACILEDDRRRVAEAAGFGPRGDAFPALYLTCRVPTGLFEEFADEIEASYPVDADWLRGKSEITSSEEYERLLRDDRVREEIYGDLDHCVFDSAEQTAFEWCMDGTRRLFE